MIESLWLNTMSSNERSSTRERSPRHCIVGYCYEQATETSLTRLSSEWLHQWHSQSMQECSLLAARSTAVTTGDGDQIQTAIEGSMLDAVQLADILQRGLIQTSPENLCYSSACFNGNPFLATCSSQVLWIMGLPVTSVTHGLLHFHYGSKFNLKFSVYI